MFDLIHALITLIVEGDYLGTLDNYGIPEDHPLVDAILTATGR